MKKNVFINALILLLLITLISCRNSNNKSVIKNDTSQLKTAVDSNGNGINSNGTKPKSKIDSKIKTDQASNSNRKVVNSNIDRAYKEVDSLIKAFNEQHEFIYLKKIDSICLKSDGDLTEELDIASQKLFYKQTSNFINYLLKNPNSCLRVRLIEALGEDYSVYDKPERPGRLLKDRDKVINKAKKNGLSEQKIEFIKYIFKKVNPDILD